MARWDELLQAIKKQDSLIWATSTDADLDTFERARGLRLPDSYREFAKTFGCCEFIGEVEWFRFATPVYGDRSGAFNLDTHDAEWHEIALENAEDALREDVHYDYANTDIAVRLVFFGSDVGGAPYGFDPEEVTDTTTSECAIYSRRDSPTNEYFRQASSLEELLLDQILANDLRAWREWMAAGCPGEDRRIRINPLPRRR